MFVTLLEIRKWIISGRPPFQADISNLLHNHKCVVVAVGSVSFCPACLTFPPLMRSQIAFILRSRITFHLRRCNLFLFFFFVTTGPYSNDVSEFTQHVLPIIVVLHKRAVNAVSPHVLNFVWLHFCWFFFMHFCNCKYKRSLVLSPVRSLHNLSFPATVSPGSPLQYS